MLRLHSIGRPHDAPGRHGRPPGGPRLVRGRAAVGEERERLWAACAGYTLKLDADAAPRSRPTQVVILEPGPVAPAVRT